MQTTVRDNLTFKNINQSATLWLMFSYKIVSNNTKVVLAIPFCAYEQYRLAHSFKFSTNVIGCIAYRCCCKQPFYSLKLKTKMRNFKTKIEGHEEEFNFVCYENTEPINIGDKYIFFFGGIPYVGVCDSESVKAEINKNDRVRDYTKIDLVTGFWRNCFKIKTTNFDLSTVS